MTEKVIRTESLTRDFGSVRALDHLSLEVPAGIIFGFLGPNGSGKTTAINLLLGLLEPTAGSADVLGFDTVKEPDKIRAQAGALLEHQGLYEQMSAAENLEYYARIWRLPEAERGVHIKELLTHMDLWERRKEKVGKWSRGMKQKLALARAMIHRPPLIFLDEPTAGLDVVAANALRVDLMGLAHQEGVTVFLTTHNMDEAERLCGQVAVIRQGSLLVVGNPDNLRAQVGGSRLQVFGQGFSETLLGRLKALPEVAAVDAQPTHLDLHLNKDIDVPALVSLLAGEGAQIDEIRKGRASLEEVFLTLMEEER